jgi:hypothetical protein
MEKIEPKKYEQFRRKEIRIEETQGFLLKSVDKQGFRHYIKC